jgi:diguanylate cyclase (GGDEF)-like protein
MGGRGWRLYGGSLLLALAVYAFVPDGPWWRAVWQVGTGYVAAAAILVGVRRLARRDRLPWWFLAFAVAVSSTGPIPDNFGFTPFGDGSTPDISDVLFLAFYPACAVAMGIMIRRLQRRIDWAALVDALTVAVGIGLLAWAYVIVPALNDPSTPVSERAVQVAYPIGDLVLLAMAILLVRSNGPRGSSAPRWIAATIGLYLAGDWAWVVVGLHDGWAELGPVGRSIDIAYMLSLACAGFAARDPAIRDGGPGAASVFRLGRGQLLLLTGGVMVAPALLVAQSLEHRVADGVAIAAGSATMFLLVVARMAQLLQQAERDSTQVRELSRRDELTGLPNRRAWTDELPRALEQARRDGTSISIGMIDVDRFKLFNDRYGHPAGDRLLQEAAVAWHGALRRSDTLARYGGEEFIVLLPGTDLEQSKVAVERVKASTPAGQTFSAGVAEWDGSETSQDLVGRADAALYAAKAGGRDRVVTAVEGAIPAGPAVAWTGSSPVAEAAVPAVSSVSGAAT